MLAVGCDDDGGDGGNNVNNLNNTNSLNNTSNANNTSTVGTLGNPCDNGVCHDGTVCIDDTCTAAGNSGEPCLPDGTCLNDNVCQENTCYDGGQEGEMCLPDGTCNEGLSCYEDFCYFAGNEGEPCFPDKSCNEGFACANESIQSDEECRPAILGRVVNCLAMSGQSVDMQLVVGMVEFPSIPSMYSTACMPVPTGGVGITVYLDGEWYEDGFMEIPADNPEVYFQPKSTSVSMYVAACNAQLQCQ